MKMVNKLEHYFKTFWAEYHLNHICINCSHHKKETRDIMHDGHCWWNENWIKGVYDEIPLWFGTKNWIRLHLLKKPIIMCINHKIYEGKEK